VFLALDFLQAQYVGRVLLEKALDDRHPQADRIDIPCNDRDHGGRLGSASGRGKFHRFVASLLHVGRMANTQRRIAMRFTRTLGMTSGALALALGACSTTASEGVNGMASVAPV